MMLHLSVSAIGHERTDSQLSGPDHDFHAIAIRNISKLQVHVTRDSDVLSRIDAEAIGRLVASLCKDRQQREAVTLAAVQVLPLRSKLFHNGFEEPIRVRNRIIESALDEFKAFRHPLEPSGADVEPSYRTG